jgi:hypothetical protein
MAKYLRKQFKGGMVYFGAQFQRFQSMVACLLHSFGRGYGGTKLLTPWTRS